MRRDGAALVISVQSRKTAIEVGAMKAKPGARPPAAKRVGAESRPRAVQIAENAGDSNRGDFIEHLPNYNK